MEGQSKKKRKVVGLERPTVRDVIDLKSGEKYDVGPYAPKNKFLPKWIGEGKVRSTCYSSAEGTSSDFVSADGSILHFCRDSKPDILGILQELTDSSSQSQTQTSSSTSATNSQQNRIESSNSSSRVVGLSSAELESLNELIHIDHVYYKPQPETPVVKSEEVLSNSNALHSASIASSTFENNKDLIGITQHLQTFAAPSLATAPTTRTTVATQLGAKRDRFGNLVFSSISPSQVSARQAATVIPSSSIPALNECRSFINESQIKPTVLEAAEELMTSLIESGIDIPSDFLPNLAFGDLLGHDSNMLLEPSTGIDSLCLPLPMSLTNDNLEMLDSAVSGKGSVTVHADIDSSLSLDDMTPRKLFDELNDGYVAPKDMSSPGSGSMSDSGMGSDIGDPMSPVSSESSLLDDYSWQDSFTDLFPDLQ